MQYVYVLKCNNDKTYVGCTSSLKDRMNRHNKGFIPATKNIRPVVVQFYISFTNKQTAFKFEKYLKSGSGRAFMRKRLL